MTNPAAIEIEFRKSGRGKARCEPNPDFPNGVTLDIAQGRTSCAIDLPYPAPECGVWVVRCKLCLRCIAITAAGRPDDPIKALIPCNLNKGEPHV